MTIPTEEDFSLWIAKAGEDINMAFTIPATFEVNEAVQFRREARAARAKVWTELQSMPAGRWLFGDPAFHRAKKIASGRRRGSAGAVAAAKEVDFLPLINRIMERVNLLSKDAHRVMWQDLLNVESRSFGWTSWECQCMRAFEEYFYDNPAQRCLAAHKSLVTAAAKMREAEDEYTRNIEILQASGLPGFESLARNRGETADGRARLLERREAPLNPALIPVRRIDELSKERFFVYRIWVTNMSFFRKPRTESIAELMCVDGFHHQYDSRTIERLCAGFSEARDRVAGARSAVRRVPV